MKTQIRSLMHSTTRTLTAAALVATLTAPSFAEAGQKPGPGDPAFDIGASLEALSAAFRDAQEQFAAQKRDGQAGAQPRQRGAQWDVQYERARQAIERAQWSQAVQQFTMLAQANAPRADAAMYWRAYALDKLNRHADALAAVGDLFKSFPASRWASDARALELQVKQRKGAAPSRWKRAKRS